MTAGRHHSSDSSEHIIDARDVEMQSYHSPNERDAPSAFRVDRKPVGTSASGNGSNSPTLIIQKNGEILGPGGAGDAAFHRDRPDRGVQVRDSSMR